MIYGVSDFVYRVCSRSVNSTCALSITDNRTNCNLVQWLSPCCEVGFDVVQKWCRTKNGASVVGYSTRQTMTEPSEE